MSGDERRFPPQQQEHPGTTAAMRPRPRDEMADYAGRGLLSDRVALVTGGDSGIGRAVCAAFAKEGADVAIAYLCEDEDASHTARLVEAAGRRAVLIRGDLTEERCCSEAVERTVAELGGLDVLVNNIAFQESAESLEEITTQQWEWTCART